MERKVKYSPKKEKTKPDFNRLMIAVRLSPQTHKQLKMICLIRDLSIQEYVTKLINEAIADEMRGM